MKERVSVIIGKKPVILVAPHGADDTNTDIITERVAKKTGCYAVINRGFERADFVDVIKDKADCNKIDHCKEEVVYEEFLKPIIKFKDRLVQTSLKINLFGKQTTKYPQCTPVTIFYIHGCGDVVHKEAKQQVSLIVGYGLGTKKDSLSCDLWRKNLFVDLYNEIIINQKPSQPFGQVFEGRGGGRYAGRDSNNLNQYFRKHSIDWAVHSMQLEFPFSTRSNSDQIEDTVCFLSDTIKNYIKYENYGEESNPLFI